MRRLARRDRRAGALLLAATVLVAVGAGACSGGGDDDAGGTGSSGATAGPTTTAARDDVLSVVVVNTEGIAAPGLDALVQALYMRPDTTAGAMAPAADQPQPAAAPASGEPPAVTFAPTAGGLPGVVVAADAATAVTEAVAGRIDGLPDEIPDLVIAGINTGQLVGSLAHFSANVPAAEAAAAAGVPALVVAQGVDESPPEYAAGVEQTLAWLEDHRDALVAGDEPAAVTLLNVPSCAAAAVRGVVEVPVAADDAGRNLNQVDCTSTAEAPADDVAAFTTGYATLSVLDTAAPG